MTLQQIIQCCIDQRVSLSVDGGQLKVSFDGDPPGEKLLAALREHKATLIAHLNGQSADQPISQVGQNEPAYASFAQSRLWFIDQMEGGSAQYNMPAAFELNGELDNDALKQAIGLIIDRHQALRTRFEQQDDQLVQVVAEDYEPPVTEYDFSELDEAAQERAVQQHLAEDAAQPFTLNRDVLMRCMIIKCNDARHVLVFNTHHIATDGWSMGILIRELIAFYAQLSAGQTPVISPLKIQYTDFANWQRQQLSGDKLRTSLDYWNQQLAELPELHGLPVDYSRPARQSFRGDLWRHELDESLTTRIKALYQQHDVTLFILMQAVFTMLIARYSGSDDVVVGTPVSGRDHPETRNLIGLFLNNLVLRQNLAGNPDFPALLEATKATLLDAYSHQHIPFEMLVEELNPERNLSHSPLFQIVFRVNTPERGSTDLPGVEIKPLGRTRETTKVDLELSITDLGETIGISWIFCSDLFDQRSIRRFADSYQTLLTAIVDNPNLPVSDYPVIPADQYRSLIGLGLGRLVEGEGAERRKSLDEMVRIQSLDIPDAIAAEFLGRSLTFAGLHDRASRLAGYLNELEIGSGDRVGICLERSLELMIALFGVMQSGACYVPLDPSSPQARLNHIVADADVEVVLTSAELMDKTQLQGIDVLLMDNAADDLDWLREFDGFTADLEHRSLEDLLYILYTSGSTGQPKGVMVRHSNVLNYLWFAAERYLDDDIQFSVVSSPLGFDATVTTLFTPLLAGKTVRLLPEGNAGIDALASELSDTQSPGLFKITPAHLELLSQRPAAQLRSDAAHMIVVGGEQFLPRTLIHWLSSRLPQATFVNEYGPTETVVGCAVYAADVETDLSGIERLDGVPVGKAIDNTRLYVVDREQRLLPPGVPGELLVAGEGVTAGYLNLPQLTAERFIADPVDPDSGLIAYKTGDRVRWSPDGQLQFIDRFDGQLKIRGFRVEPAEIRTQLMSLEGVRDCVVTAFSESQGESLLTAYIVQSNSIEADQPGCVTRLRAGLSETLPDYMIPSHFVFLDTLPLTSNGKVDLRSLPDPRSGHTQRNQYVAPRTDSESTLVEIWQELLSVERIGIHDNFFDLGGHSLLAMRLLSRVRQTMQVELPIKALFEYPNIAELAGLINRTARSEELPEIERQDRSAQLPLSYAQRRLWFIDQLEGATPQYNLPIGLMLEGALHTGHLRTALHQLIIRHEVLRTHFGERGGEVYQVICDRFELPISELDLSDLDSEARALEIQRLAELDARTAFDLSSDLMIRVQLIRISGTEHVLLFNMHHIASDGWSMGVLIREFAQLYNALCSGVSDTLAELPIQYADYAAWQQQWLADAQLQAQLDYWKARLAGIPEIHDLPLDHARPQQQRFSGRNHRQVLDERLSRRLKAMSAEQDVTLFILLQTAFSLLLARYSNSTDIVVGTPVAGRDHPDLESLIGFFVNTLALRLNVDGNPAFEQLLQQNKADVLDAFAHQHIPFEMLVEELQPQRNLAFSPVFQILFALQNNERSELSLDGLTAGSLPHKRNVVKFDLELVISERKDGLQLSWSFNTDLFEQHTIERMAECFDQLLRGIVADPSQRVQEIPLMEAADLLSGHGPSSAPLRQFSPEDCLQHRFEQQVEGYPDRIALTLDNQSLDYRELNCRANRLAHFLIGHGVKPDQLIGVYMDRSVELLVVILGILKSGAAYLPIDPRSPGARTEYILQDSAAVLLITQDSLKTTLPESGCETVVLEQIDNQLQQASSTNPDHQQVGSRPDHLAYVIYTSGSTGKPKGVMVEHRHVMRLFDSAGEHFDFSADDVWTLFHSYAFDFSVWEIWGSLLYGGRLVIVPSDLVADTQAYASLLVEQQVTVLNQTPSAFYPLSEYLAQHARGHRLRYVVFGGEALDFGQLQTWYQANQSTNTLLVNMYGITETTVHVTYYELDAEQTASQQSVIGQPLSDLGVAICNDHMQLQPNGVVGELLICGGGVSRGYLNKPELTDERFVQLDLGHGPTTYYRSGDLVYRTTNGDLVFVGRRDSQVKIRGFRIELGEIEAILTSLESIKNAVVETTAAGPDSRLIAYVVPTIRMPEDEGSGHSDQADWIASCKSELALQLPGYMVPDSWIVMDVLPLTVNGKVDRRALSALAGDGSNLQEYVAPQSDIESRLCELWAQVLKLERVGVQDNFFEQGGHSLLATRLISLIREEFSAELPLKALFESPTVSGIASCLQQQTDDAVLPAIEVQKQRSNLPLSFAQQRLWFIDQLEGASPQYNLPRAFRLSGQLDINAFEQALKLLLDRHEILRTCIVDASGDAYQSVQTDVSCPLKVTDFSNLSAKQAEAQVQQRVQQDRQRPFDLRRELPLRVELLVLPEREYVALFNMHHIASDGWSIGIMIREFSQLYHSCTSGEANPLPELPVQYGDYAFWQRDWLKGDVLADQVGYWRNQLAGVPQVHSLPLDRPRPAQQSFRGRTHHQRLDRSLIDRLQSLCQLEDATLFMGLQTAFAMLLSRYSGEQDIVIGSPIAGRTHRDVESLIGFFVNSLVLRSDISPDRSFKQQLKLNKKMLLDAYSHQHIPFEMLVDELKPERSLSHAPLFQIVFALQNAEKDAPLEMPGLTLAPVGSSNEVVRFDLELIATEFSGGLALGWSYNTDLFDALTVERMAANFEALLSALVAEPDAESASLTCVSVEEHQLLLEWNSTDTGYPKSACVHELFEVQAANQPDATAVVCGADKLTYRQLNCRANQLADFLIEQGLDPGELVGINMDRSLEMVVGILAILKAGGAYLPLDASYPAARLKHMVEDTKLRYLLTQRHLASAIQVERQYCLDDPEFIGSLDKYCSDNLRIPHSADDLAYVIYTSGSTGLPKGTMAVHRSIVRLVHGCTPYVRDLPVIRCIQSAPVSFDAATFEFWMPLLSGGELVMYDDTQLDLERFNAVVEQHQVNLAWLTAGLFDLWVNMKAAATSPLSVLFTGGDVVSPASVKSLYEKNTGISVVNGYGPTENVTFTCCHEISRDHDVRRSVPIGKPISDTQVYVLSPQKTPVPVGGVGELYIGGAGLAQGYLNQPELTAEKFVDVTLSGSATSQRLYRSGDQVRWLADGTIEFIGRIDNQVKIRGFRIEPGEVESRLSDHVEVSDCFVSVFERGDSDKSLVAYVVLKNNPPPDDLPAKQSMDALLVRHLKTVMPSYMLPALFIYLEKLPLTENGKVDRQRLPEPAVGDLVQAAYVAPENEIEQRLCEAWQAILGLSRVGVHDNFFSLGGHSLMAIRLANAISAELGVEVNVKTIFETPTIKQQAEFIATVMETVRRQDELFESAEELEEFEL